MTHLLLAFDILLAASLVLLAWRLLAARDLFRGIVLFITFGVLMAICWVRLRAPDLALVEVAIGAGLTGALFLHTLSQLEGSGEAGSNDGRRPEQGRSRQALAWRGAVGVATLVLLLLLGWSIASLPRESMGVGPLVFENLEASGVKNPVTAALLNFRALDTMLEVVVLLVAMIGAWSLQVRQIEPLARAPGLLLERFTHWIVPVFVVVAGYLLWAGADATGGAFQAGAVLAAAGVLWILTHGRLSDPRHRKLWRVCFTLGIFVFVAVGFYSLAVGLAFLEYPRAWAKPLILLIETASTITIAATLIGLFAGSQRGLEGELAPMGEDFGEEVS